MFNERIYDIRYHVRTIYAYNCFVAIIMHPTINHAFGFIIIPSFLKSTVNDNRKSLPPFNLGHTIKSMKVEPAEGFEPPSVTNYVTALLLSYTGLYLEFQCINKLYASFFH